MKLEVLKILYHYSNLVLYKLLRMRWQNLIFNSPRSFSRRASYNFFLNLCLLIMKKRYLQENITALVGGLFLKPTSVFFSKTSTQMTCPVGLTSASCFSVLEPVKKEWRFVVEMLPPPPQQSELPLFVCQQCGPTRTRQIRRGPTGPRTLCNRCYHSLL